MASQTDLIQLLCDLIALPSVNPEWDAQRITTPFGECRVADYVQRYFQPFGVRIERLGMLPGRENVLVHIPGQDPSVRPILLEAHMDTVGVEGMDQPFSPRVEGGRVYGRGASDTKGSLATMMMAVRGLLEGGWPLRRGCVLVAAADEEFGMTGARWVAQSGMAFAGAIVGEPTALKPVTAHDGQMYCRITARGKAAHTSMPQHGANAIYAINDVVNVLRRRADQTYPQRQHPLCGPPKLTVSMIRGGVAEHIVPDSCEIVIDCRVIPGESCQQMLDEIKGWLVEDLDPATCGRIKFAAPHKTEPPMETHAGHPLVHGLCQAIAHVLGQVQVVGVPYNTDASHYGAAGIPCVVFGPGDIAQSHGLIEFVEIEQVVAAVRILSHFLATETIP